MLHLNTTNSNLHENIELDTENSVLSFKEGLMKKLSVFINLESFQITEKEIINGLSGQDHQFDYLIMKKLSNLSITESNEIKTSLKNYYKKNKEKIGVIVKNYKKPCGINVINEVATIFKDCNLFRIILCSKDFSKSAYTLARRKNIILLSCDNFS